MFANHLGYPNNSLNSSYHLPTSRCMQSQPVEKNDMWNSPKNGRLRLNLQMMIFLFFFNFWWMFEVPVVHFPCFFGGWVHNAPNLWENLSGAAENRRRTSMQFSSRCLQTSTATAVKTGRDGWKVCKIGPCPHPGSNTKLVGGWTNPFEKYARQIGSLPQGLGEKKMFETTTQWWF